MQDRRFWSLLDAPTRLTLLRVSFFLGKGLAMLTLYFCLDGSPSVIRYWTSVPRIGDTVSLPEIGGNLNLLKVYDVIWEGTMEASVSVYVHHAKVDHALCHDQEIHAGLRGDGSANGRSRQFGR